MKILKDIGLALLAIFAPVKPMMLAAAALVIADLITGIMAARKRKEAITSAGFKRTVGKIALYEIAICLAFLTEQYLTGDLLPASKLVAALIGLTELKSVLENLDSISGESFFKSVLSRITQAQAEKEDK